MASESVRICHQAFLEALKAFSRAACPQEGTPGEAPSLAEAIDEGWRHALFTFRQQTSNVAAEVSAPQELLLVRTLAGLEADLRRGMGTQTKQGGPSPEGVAAVVLGNVVAQTTTAAAWKAGELAVMSAKPSLERMRGAIPPFNLAHLPVALGVSFVAGVGIFAIDKLVENFRQAYSSDAAEETPVENARLAYSGDEA